MVGDGMHSPDMVNVKDVAEAVTLALLRPESIGQVYNIANEKNPSWNELLKAVSKELDIPFTEKHISYKKAYRMAGLMEFLSLFSMNPPKLSRYSVRQMGKQYDYSIQKAKDELGFEPSVDLIEGIRESIKSQ